MPVGAAAAGVLVAPGMGVLVAGTVAIGVGTVVIVGRAVGVRVGGTVGVVIGVVVVVPGRMITMVRGGVLIRIGWLNEFTVSVMVIVVLPATSISTSLRTMWLESVQTRNRVIWMPLFIHEATIGRMSELELSWRSRDDSM